MKIKWTLFLLWMAIGLHGEKEQALPINNAVSNQQFLAEQTNLALRQVGHQLLLLAGNDTSSIAPVQQQNGQVFLLPIAESFNYDTLPFLLHSALTDLGMEQEMYFVAVKDCGTDTLILGYDVRQFQKGRVPCIGRHQYANCNHIFVTFPNRSKVVESSYNWMYGLLMVSFFGIGLYYFFKSRKEGTINVTPKKEHIPVIPNKQLITIGNSQLDVTNQLIYIHNDPATLTFRETKLLHYFVSNVGQLLNREQLLEKVWADEGVIVGRSLDVFVSRLRKILKADASLGIKTVHGVGYRLEVHVSDTSSF